MFNFLKIHRTIFFFVLFLFLAVPWVVWAQNSQKGPDLDIVTQNTVDGFNKGKFDTQTFKDTVEIGICGLTGCDSKEFKIGALGVTSSLIAGMYANPPASGITYVAQKLERFGVQQAYAQSAGTGYGGLLAIEPVWRAFRNISYVLFVIVFIGLGLAVMFRVKLDPRTAITIQSALPRIVVALLLVTFSYAIAGFMIDILYVLISLIILAFSGLMGDLNQYLTGGFPTVWGALWGAIGGGPTALKLGAAALGGLIGGALVGGIPIIGGVAAPILAGLAIGAALLLLVILLIVLYLIFKLFIELLKSYIFILIGVILAPLQITLGVIPGVPGFGAWFKNMAANILVFPAVAFVLILGQVMTGAIGKAEGFWNPPLLVGGSLGAQFASFLIGFGILLVVHQVPQVVKNMFGRDLGFNPMQAVMESPVRLGQLAYGKYKERGEKEKRRAQEEREKNTLTVLEDIRAGL